MTFEFERVYPLPKESHAGNSHTATFSEHGGRTIDIYKLIHLSESLETTTTPIAELEPCKQNAYWFDKNGDWLGPGMILDEMKTHGGDHGWNEIITRHPEWEDELQKIRNADYKSHPLILIGNTVVDGMHRLTRAWIDGATTIEVKRFSELPVDALLPDKKPE